MQNDQDSEVDAVEAVFEIAIFVHFEIFQNAKRILSVRYGL
jgi:hypothetical protein